jgi:purine nucleosidase/pyrimidine-specific ribonucleoside hydrolase
MEKKKKILIDTDIGDDIDDALALFFAMKLDFDIVGLTTVFQNTVLRARLVKKLLKGFGNGYESVPVYAGHGEPIDDRREKIPLNQYTSDLEDAEYAPDCENADEAVDFIIDCCKKYGEELTVIAIGPFTNIARVIEKDPNAFDGIGGFVIMGGAYYKQYVDWNVYCDVIAADIMFRSVKNIQCIGADVTHKTVVGDGDCKKIREYSGNDSGALELSKIYNTWWESGRSPKTVLHDPLAIYYAFDRSVCETEKQSVAVITEGYGKGLTLNVDAYSKAFGNPAYSDFDFANKHTTAKDVDVQKVIDAFMRCF